MVSGELHTFQPLPLYTCITTEFYRSVQLFLADLKRCSQSEVEDSLVTNTSCRLESEKLDLFLCCPQVLSPLGLHHSQVVVRRNRNMSIEASVMQLKRKRIRYVHEQQDVAES